MDNQFILNYDELFIIINPMKCKPGPKKRMVKRITISLIDGQSSYLEKCAARDGGSLSQIVRTALTEFLEKNQEEAGK